MTTKAELKSLLEAEILLRPETVGNSEHLQEWVDAVKALRQATPDWALTMLSLLNELERAGQPAGEGV